MKKLLLLFAIIPFLTYSLSAQCVVDITTLDTNCGDTDGEAIVNISNGTPPYTYTFLGQTTTTNDVTLFFNGLPAGNYTIDISDSNSCQQTVDFIINGSAPMEITTTTTSADCGNQNGCIFVEVNGGAAPFTYFWDSPSAPNTAAVCGLADGAYQVTITDNDGCSVIATTIIDSAPPPIITIEEQIINCNLSVLTATAFEGTPPYTYNWSNGFIGPSIDVMAQGTFIVTVTDSNGCFSEVIYTYNGGSLFFQPIINNMTCWGSADGEISGTFAGTTTPSVTWTGPNGFTSNTIAITGLAAGQYTMMADDGMGCTNTFGPYEIIEPEQLEITALAINVSCFGSNDGAIDLTVIGGTPPFSFIWSHGETVEDPTNLAAGIYSVTITDANDCEATTDVVVLEPNEIILNVTSTDQSCQNDGQANASVSGGTPPYEFQWSTGENTPEINNLIAGSYAVTVIDLLGCTVTQSFTIDSPIDLEVTSTFADCDIDNGTATVTILGGSTNPTYAWSNGASSAEVTDLAADWYSVTVTDGVTDCRVHQNIQVLEDTICYVIIEGYVYVDDIQQDCLMDSTTIPASQVRVELSDGQVRFTDSDGYYQFEADAGSYTITIDPNASYADLCSSPINIDALEWGMTFSDNDFYLKYSELIDVRIKVVKFNARPGFTQTVRICLMNRGASPASGTLTFTHPDILDFISSSPMETGYDSTTNMVTYDYVDLPPNTTWIYNPLLQVPIGTPLGTPLDYSFSAPLVGDINPVDNEENCTILVTGSYDPNDKAVSPAGIGPEGIISMDDSKLNYKIRFQNTGTDTAFTVLIRDTLDIDLDWRTFEPGPASHDYVASIVNGNIVELLFENILLPDSFVNEPASNGFVMFDIDIKDGSPYGTRIENTAGIYFDFNPPIITNTVQNLIQMIVDVEEKNEVSLDLLVTPNPTSGITNLSFSLEESDLASIALYDNQGHLVKIMEQSLFLQRGIQNIEIPMQDLSAGIYFVRLTTKNGQVGFAKVLRL